MERRPYPKPNVDPDFRQLDAMTEPILQFSDYGPTTVLSFLLHFAPIFLNDSLEQLYLFTLNPDFAITTTIDCPTARGQNQMKILIKTNNETKFISIPTTAVYS